MLLQLFLISIVLVAIALIGIGVKMFVVKGGEFKKQCGSVDPTTGQRLGCTCHNSDKSQCDNETIKINSLINE